MNMPLQFHPTPTELQAHTRHRAFHRSIAVKAASIAKPAPPAPPEPDPPMDARAFYKEAWFFIEGVSPCPTLTMAQIRKAVCDHFGQTLMQMVTGRRSKTEVIPRQLAMYLCKELTKQSLPQIGKFFGGSDHTTVMHACRRVPVYCAKDPAFAEAVAKIRAGLEAML